MPLVFFCAHCNSENQVDSTLAGCVMNCARCGRSVIVPIAPLAALPGVPPFGKKAAGQFLACAGFALGASLLLGFVSFVLAAFIERQTIGMSMDDVVLVGLIGAAAGAFFGGVIGWRVSRE